MDTQWLRIDSTPTPLMAEGSMPGANLPGTGDLPFTWAR